MDDQPRRGYSKHGVKLGRPVGSKTKKRKNGRPKGAQDKKPRKHNANRGPHTTHGSTRWRGQPPAGESPLPPAATARINSAWLRGVSIDEMAKDLNVHRNSIINHVESRLLPQFRAELHLEASSIIQRIRAANDMSWGILRANHEDKAAQTLFCWSADSLVKILGVAAPVKVQIEGYRVAGRKPAVIEEEMLTRLAARIEDLRYSTASTVDAVSHETREEQAQGERSQPPVM
jgi:hypothetical protein